MFVNLLTAYLPHGSMQSRSLATALVGGVFGIYLFYRGFLTLQRKRLIANTPASKVRGAAMGLVEVSGLATGPYTIPAPITGVPCYYYRTIAWQIKKSGNNQHWEKIADDSLHVPFYLDDNTGKLLVNPQGAELDIHRDFCETYSDSLFSSNLGVPSTVAGFLGRHGINYDKKTKVEEFCIKPKNALFILGTLSQNHGVNVSALPVRSLVTELPKVSMNHGGSSQSSSQPELSGRVGTEQVIRLSGNERPVESSAMSQQERLASALCKAGITNPAAWAVAGIQGRASQTSVSSSSAAAVQTATEPFDFSPPVILEKGARNTALLISWRSQRELVRSLGWKCALSIWGGPLLTLLCAYTICAQFGWL